MPMFLTNEQQMINDQDILSFSAGTYRMNDVPVFRVVFSYAPKHDRFRSNVFRERANDLIAWCEENVGVRGEKWAARFAVNYTDFFFYDEHDAVMFKLLNSDGA
jgi:hypothetical protein